MFGRTCIAGIWNEASNTLKSEDSIPSKENHYHFFTLPQTQTRQLLYHEVISLLQHLFKYNIACSQTQVMMFRDVVLALKLPLETKQSAGNFASRAIEDNLPLIPFSSF